MDPSKRTKDKRHRQIGYLALGTGVMVNATGLVWCWKYSQREKAGLHQLLPMMASCAGWAFCVLKAYRYIKQKNVEQHSKWMIRSYAASFAFPSRFTGMFFAKILGWDFPHLWGHIIWGAILGNMMIGEYTINQMYPGQKDVRKEKRLAVEVEV